MDTSTILLVMGDEERAHFVQQAVAHPEIAVEVYTQENFVQKIRSKTFDLAIVGGMIGSRGPLVLCESVRMGQQLPVIVLLDARTNQTAINAHRNLGIRGVQYLECDPQVSLESLGDDLRQRVLGLCEREEDADALAVWRSVGAVAEAQRQASLEAVVTTENSSAETAVSEPRETENATPEPPFLTQLADDDLEFADRIVERTKATDFRRVTVHSPREAGAEDNTVERVRERVRELERQLARLAFVYKIRKKKFDDADGRIANMMRLKDELEGHVAQLQQQLAEQNQQREQSFNAVLSQAGQAFGQLRDQSAEAVQRSSQELESKQKELEGVLAQNEDLREQLVAAHARLTEAFRERDELERCRMTSLGEHEQVLSDKDAKIESLTARLEKLSEQIERLTAREEHAAAPDLVKQMGEVIEGGSKQTEHRLQQLHSEIAKQADAIETLVAHATPMPGMGAAQIGMLQWLAARPGRVFWALIFFGGVCWMATQTYRSYFETAWGHRGDGQGLADETDTEDDQQRAVATRLSPAAKRAQAEIEALAQEESPAPLPTAPSGLNGAAESGTIAQQWDGTEEAPPPESAPGESDTEGVDDVALETPKPKTPAVIEGAGAPNPGRVNPSSGKAAPRAATEDRKSLRKKMFDARKQKRWKETIDFGIALRDGFGLDWEAEYYLAQAYEQAQQLDEAVKTYVSFASGNADNVYADDAFFSAASIRLKQNRRRDARVLFRKVADNEKSKLRDKAKEMLRKL
ncbi:MAG: hypothetical protein R3C68_13570 [Myxococcota bacterium]